MVPRTKLRATRALASCMALLQYKTPTRQLSGLKNAGSYSSKHRLRGSFYGFALGLGVALGLTAFKATFNTTSAADDTPKYGTVQDMKKVKFNDAF